MHLLRELCLSSCSQQIKVKNQSSSEEKWNLANIETAGFKKQYAFFHNLRQLDDADPSGLAEAINGPVVETRTGTDFSSGTLQETGNPLDMAIEGDGFFILRWW